MRFSILGILLILSVGWVTGFQITEVYPDTFLNGDADEYLVITGAGLLDSLEITDGEGTLAFPPGSISSGTVTIARDGDAFFSVTGHYPDFELVGKSDPVPNLHGASRFQLGNKKDEIHLIQAGVVIQNISWPGTFKPRKGQVHYLGPQGWDERVLMSGGSRFEPVSLSNISGTAFVSPDCGRSVFEKAISSAKRSILVNVYEFTDPGFAESLCQAADRGVTVTVLLEGGPVGGIPPDEEKIISRLSACGIPVLAMSGTGEDHTPYRFNHAKYLVIDDESLLLTTENFKPHSFPPAGMGGNRGWGVFLISPPLASYFSEVFASDLNGPGIIQVWGNNSETYPYAGDPYPPVFSPVDFADARVTPVLSPDTSSLIVPFIEGTSRRLLIEQAYIKHWSDGRRNPYLEAAIQAARRGVDVRILLDSYPYNIEDDADNDEIVAEVNRIAKQEQIPLQARLIDLPISGLVKLHAKGVVADDAVFISSVNWNENSPVFNREAGVIIEHKGVADYFSSVFEQDWNGAVHLHTTGSRVPDLMKIIAAIGSLTLVLVLYWWRHRRN